MALDKKLSEFDVVSILKAKKSHEKIISDMGRASASAVVTLFEIDLEQLYIDEHMTYITAGDRSGESVFRFHNNLKLTKQKIYWKGQTYHPLPIKVEGFDSNTRGAMPTPRMSMMSSDDVNEGPAERMFRDFRVAVRKLDDLIGAKLTRVRTFAKYLDAENFYMLNEQGLQVSLGDDVIKPEGFEPDPLAEFPREIFFINRKSSESKDGIEFELASFMDFENLKLPSRIVLSRYCQFQYRGAGCIYEYESEAPSNKDDLYDGFGSDSKETLNFPCKAPPIANENNELFSDALEGEYNPDPSFAQYDPSKGEEGGGSNNYGKGDQVYLIKNQLKYYFIGKENNIPPGETTPSAIPPNTNFWYEDQCSKDVMGCKIRWSDAYKIKIEALGPNSSNLIGTPDNPGSFSMNGCRPNDTPNGATHAGCLPFGGFPAVEKIEKAT